MLYDLNTKRINDQLAYLDKCLQVLEQAPVDQLSTEQRFAVERALHIAVECMIDVGSVMIDGFIMRDPGGYHDIVDILLDERVIPSDLAVLLGNWIQLREQLVRAYTSIEAAELLARTSEAKDVRGFIECVQKYVAKELAK